MKTKIVAMALLAALGILLTFQLASARLMARDNVDTTETIAGDKYLKGQSIRNEGLVKGDLYLWGQNALSKGTVEGDIIGAGLDVSVNGNVAGNVRIAAVTSSIAGNVGKNVMVFGKSFTLSPESKVVGSVTIFAASVDMRGKVKGHTIIGGRDVVLGGEFYGDVDVNQFANNKIRRHDYRSLKTQLTVLPGTKIHGVLKFKGANADIQKGSEIKDFQWTKSEHIQKKWYDSDIYRYVWKFVRLVFTTAVYFLLGLLLIKVFPAFTQSVAESVLAAPAKSLGVGLISVVSIIGAVVVCTVLLVLSLIMSPALGIVTTIFMGVLYVVLFYLAALPAALWVGNLMFKDRSVQYRLGSGLIVLKGGLFIFMILTVTPVVGYVFSVLSVLAKLGVVFLGSGAILCGIKTIWSARRCD